MFRTLNAWRGIFILLIFIHHCYVIPWSNQNGFGSTGVTYFFFLSGFLLAYHYKRSIVENTFSYSNFLIKRITKIYPIHWIVAIFFLWLTWDEVLMKAVPLNFMLLQSWFPLYKVYFSLNGASWFLSSIVFCYIAFPFLVRFFEKWGKGALILFVIYAFAWILYSELYPPINEGWGNKAGWYNHNPMSRVVDFGCGILCCYLYDYLKTISIKIPPYLTTVAEIFCCILITILLYDYSLLPWGLDKIVMAMFILTFALQERGILSKLLQNRALMYMGKISFSFYIIHTAVICGFDYNLPFHYSVTALIELGITLILSIMSFHLLEPYTSKMMSKILKRAIKR